MASPIPPPAVAAGLSGVSVSSPKEKLSVYPTPDPPLVLVETSSPLEQQISIARKSVTGAYNDAHAAVQSAVGRWIGVEQAIEKEIKSIAPPREVETLTPGLLYVGVATLAASILTRRRSLPIRLLLPPTFFLVSFSNFLPHTSANTSSYFHRLERTHAPQLADAHEQFTTSIHEQWDRANSILGISKAHLQYSLSSIVDAVEKNTGLKLNEVFRGQGNEKK